MKILSINVGLMGHVDCGKTSLAKCLSTVPSTACFDKHPQSQERGITIDLGFSSFIVEAPENVKESGYNHVQYTLVDCPGHAALIRTIIAGAQIIDLVLLIVDITKGFQTQTAECLIIAEIMQKPIMIVMNKTLQLHIKTIFVMFNIIVSNKILNGLRNTAFKNVLLVATSTKLEVQGSRVQKLINILKANTFVPERSTNSSTMILAVDHCFLVKGKGTVMTGTVIQGTLTLNDVGNIPTQLLQLEKIKSIQMFKKEITEAHAGDRIGVCVTQFNPKLLERGIACSVGHLSQMYGAVIRLNHVRYFKPKITSGSKFHVSVGHENLVARITLFSCPGPVRDDHFSFDKEYNYEEQYKEHEVGPDRLAKLTYYVLLEYDKPLIVMKNSLIICSKFDIDFLLSNSCRIAFYGNSVYDITDQNYKITVLPNLLIFKEKQKIGYVQRICNDKEVIAHSMFKKQNKVPEQFINLKVKLSTGEDGVLENSFGQGGKVKIGIPDGLKLTTKKQFEIGKLRQESKMFCPIEVILKFKKHIFDKSNKIIQS
uniref:Tr-type G domain-containing protein n=1 Tax=Rhodnius prolixus TaxID=13249 RepID=T1HV40_RHOPR